MTFALWKRWTRRSGIRRLFFFFFACQTWGASGTVVPTSWYTSQHITAMVTVVGNSRWQGCVAPHRSSALREAAGRSCGQIHDLKPGNFPGDEEQSKQEQTHSPSDFLWFRLCTYWKRLEQQAEEDSAVIARSYSSISARKFPCCICGG